MQPTQSEQLLVRVAQQFFYLLVDFLVNVCRRDEAGRDQSRDHQVIEP